MGKVDVYIGGYIVLDSVSKEESDCLASNACMVGMPVDIEYNAETSEFKVVLPNGDSIGIIRPSNKLSIREAIEEGWTRSCCLSLVYYENETKHFGGEIVYQMFHVKPSQTKEQANLEAYTKKTVERIASGKRPDITITGDSWDQVIETGDWEGETSVALPISTKRNSGTVVFKRKRSISDRMVTALIERRPSARIGLTIAIIVIAALVLLLVWSCTA